MAGNERAPSLCLTGSSAAPLICRTKSATGVSSLSSIPQSHGKLFGREVSSKATLGYSPGTYCSGQCSFFLIGYRRGVSVFFLCNFPCSVFVARPKERAFQKVSRKRLGNAGGRCRGHGVSYYRSRLLGLACRLRDNHWVSFNTYARNRTRRIDRRGHTHYSLLARSSQARHGIHRLLLHGCPVNRETPSHAGRLSPHELPGVGCFQQFSLTPSNQQE